MWWRRLRQCRPTPQSVPRSRRSSDAVDMAGAEQKPAEPDGRCPVRAASQVPWTAARPTWSARRATSSCPTASRYPTWWPASLDRNRARRRPDRGRSGCDRRDRHHGRLQCHRSGGLCHVLTGRACHDAGRSRLVRLIHVNQIPWASRETPDLLIFLRITRRTLELCQPHVAGNQTNPKPADSLGFFSTSGRGRT